MVSCSDLLNFFENFCFFIKSKDKLEKEAIDSITGGSCTKMLAPGMKIPEGNLKSNCIFWETT